MPDSLFGVLYQCWPQPDGSLRLEFLSEGAERLLEATADEVLKGLVDGTFPLVGVDREKFYADFAESVTRHSSWKAEFGYVGPKSGVVRWFRAQDFPRRTAEGAAYFSGVLIDITELKRAEERAREAYSELEAHLANTPLAVVEWDREARIRRWSGRAEAMFGWRADEVLGRTVYELDFVHEGISRGCNPSSRSFWNSGCPATSAATATATSPASSSIASGTTRPTSTATGKSFRCWRSAKI